MAAAIALYMLLSDGEKGAEVYSAAVDRDQASLVFHAAEQMVRNDPELSAMLEIIPSQRRMLHHAPGGVGIYRAIPADAPHAHGFNASAIIYDELHAAPNRELWDVLTTSIGARRQPLIFVITTAGFDRQSICWELHEFAEKVRDGVITDPTFLPVLYGAPDDADWLDERVWHAANPALGDFRELDEMRTAAFQAREVPARQNSFRRLYLCQWTESETRWLDPDAWAACGTEAIDLEALRGRRCYVGLDLSSTSDLTACVAVFRDEDGGYTVVPHFWLPERQPPRAGAAGPRALRRVGAGWVPRADRGQRRGLRARVRLPREPARGVHGWSTSPSWTSIPGTRRAWCSGSKMAGSRACRSSRREGADLADEGSREARQDAPAPPRQSSGAALVRGQRGHRGG